MNRLVNRRIRLFLAALTIAFAALLLRATWLQGVRAESLSQLGRTQHREAVTIPAGRGTIYDRRGVELALGERATTIYANPMQIANPRAAAVAVERTLGLDADRLYPLLADHSRGFVYVERQADPAQAAALQRLKLPGFGFYPEERRNYPQRWVGSQVLGYVGIDGNGLAGLELHFDRELAGRPGKETVVKDPSGRVIDVENERGTVNYSVAQILAHSSNIGAITLAQVLGRTRLSSWITHFGFGRTSGVDFPGESPGIVLPPEKWSGSTIGNVPIGQGIAVTPV